ncbi:MAG: hypothetical protein HN531_05435 [Opitutae bacterium]|jgi:hypothetical protein|nr:hypothetical protein [Opitutae bacterium]
MIPSALPSPLLLLATCVAFFQSFGEHGNWEKVKTEDGVAVYEKKISGKLAFRGVGEIAGDPSKLIGVLENPVRWKHWIDNFKSGRLLEKKSDFHKVFYQSFDSPFPVSDRDLVYESKISSAGEGRTVRVEMRSVRHALAPKTVGVRVKLTYASYRIEVLGKERMKVTFETMSDPGGAIPGFMANWATRSYPVTLFDGLRKEMKRPDQKEAPLPR